MNSTIVKDSAVAFLAELWEIPLVKITWWSDLEGNRIWGFTLEDGQTAMCPSSEIMNQKKFHTKMLGVGVLPLDVRTGEWKETVVQRILQAAEPRETKELAHGC